MKIKIALVMLAVALIPIAGAAPSASCGAYQVCVNAEVGNIAGVIGGGNLHSSTAFRGAAHAGDAAGLSNTITAPAVTTPVITYTVSNLVGCTIGAQSTQQSLATTFSQFSVDYPLTLTDTTCTGTLRIQMVGGALAAEVWDQLVRFTIAAEGDIDTLSRACDSSAYGAACDNVALNTAALLIPFLAFIALAAWAETKREPLLYVLAVVAGMICVIQLPAALVYARLLIVGAMALLGLRAFQEVNSNKAQMEDND